LKNELDIIYLNNTPLYSNC